MNEFETLWNEHKAFFWRKAWQLTNRRVDAEDLLSTTALKVMTRLHQLTDIQAFKAWVVQIMVNILVDYLRGHYAKVEITDMMSEDWWATTVHARTVSTPTVTSDLMVRELCSTIGEDDAFLIVDHSEGMSSQEMAAARGIEIGALKTRLYRAKERARCSPQFLERVA